MTPNQTTATEVHPSSTVQDRPPTSLSLGRTQSGAPPDQARPGGLTEQVEAAVAGREAHALVRAFAANPAFRAAEWEELTTEDNPYRRPVRPDDLAWLDYATPLRSDTVLRLSGLLGHRMLRNIYDADLLYLPPGRSAAAERDAAAFYSPANRLRGALARPVLEHHLFAFLADDRDPAPGPGPEPGGGLPTLRRELHGYWEQRRDHPGEAFRVLGGTRDRREATTFALLQLSAFLPAARTAVARAALGEYKLAHPDARGLLLATYQRWVGDAAGWTALLAAAGLQPTVGAYWQLYLNTSLARGNHLHLLSRAPERHAELLGAYVHQHIDDAGTAAAWAGAVEDGLGARPAPFVSSLAPTTPGELDRLVDALLTPLLALAGDAALTAFRAGFADARRLRALWDCDLAAQLAWADAIEEHKARARTIDAYLTAEGIEVDLDTFVESSEETSTTHVHDEHRLVMIESGQMHFWNNVTHKISLSDGDKILIPQSRLHGSTVLSGSCTYHQPIIPNDLLQEIESH
ncbi:peptide synthetase [Frankia tisae]|uniref:peptide synthetase n=1 Tax=Frankia tisae TaxID=2950104 RepID=UPI0021BE4E68|nr:peptide synthetase [Frankia tisae]